MVVPSHHVPSVDPANGILSADQAIDIIRSYRSAMHQALLRGVLPKDLYNDIRSLHDQSGFVDRIVDVIPHAPDPVPEPVSAVSETVNMGGANGDVSSRSASSSIKASKPRRKARPGSIQAAVDDMRAQGIKGSNATLREKARRLLTGGP